MSFTGESQNFSQDPESIEAWILKDDLNGIIDRYADHFVNLRDSDGQPGNPTEKLLGGQTEGYLLDTYEDISLVVLSFDGQLIATISVGGEKYEIDKKGIRNTSDPFAEVSDDEFDEVRIWLSSATTWDKSHSDRIVASMRKFDDSATEL